MKHIYPEEKQYQIQGPPVIFHRWRIAVPCFDEESVKRLSEKIAEFAGHSVECFVGVTDEHCDEILAEAVMSRETVPLNVLVPAKETE